MTSLSEVWNEICFLLRDSIKGSCSEKDFENQVVRVLEVLGWREYKNEIARQPTLQFGREGTIRPDLVIYSQNRKALIVIEVKRPSENITKENVIGQLRSYMRQMKADFGFLVGEELRVYYDGHLNPQPDPLILEKIPFVKDSSEGHSFIQNFCKSGFESGDYKQYLDKKIKKFSKKKEVEQLVRILCKNDTKQKIISFLRKEYADYGDDSFSTALKKVQINICTHTQEQVTEKNVNHSSAEILPRKPRRKIIRSAQNSSILNSANTNGHSPANIRFESHLEIRLSHIYCVIYFMKHGYDFTTAIHQTLKLYPEVQDYQTISDKCARGFAGSVDIFVRWFNSGQILDKLSQKFSLSTSDYMNFKKLLENQ